MNQKTRDNIVTAVLERGLDDWMYFALLDDLVGKYTNAEDKETRLAYSVEVIRTLMERDWIQVGELGADGFFSWNLPIDQTLERIRVNARSMTTRYGPSDVCWLCNTIEGDSQAKPKGTGVNS